MADIKTAIEYLAYGCVALVILLVALEKPISGSRKDSWGDGE